MKNYFTELYAVDVSAHIEKKNGFSYVSWPFAIAELRKRHPTAVWEVVRFEGMPFQMTPAGVFVEVAVTVEGIRLSQIHPVINHANKPIKEPTSFEINTSIQRCLVKAIALHGLGLFVYAGEDLPEDVKKGQDAEAEKKSQRGSELEEFALYLIDCHHQGKDLDAIRVWYDQATWIKDDETEEKLYVWNLLKQESKLRSTIKSNKPGVSDARAEDAIGQE